MMPTLALPGDSAPGHEDHRRVRALLVDGVVEGVEHRDALDVLAALARRDAGDDVRAVAAGVFLGGRGPPPPGAAGATTLAAASSIVLATSTFGRLASARILRPSTSFVPSRRTTNGTEGLICSKA